MLGRGNEIVITVDSVRKEATERQEEVRVAANNNSSGLREWIIEEAAWLVAQFTKVAMSVAVVRGVHQLFRVGFASESAYQRARTCGRTAISSKHTGVTTLGPAAPLGLGDPAAEVLAAQPKAAVSIKVPITLLRTARAT